MAMATSTNLKPSLTVQDMKEVKSVFERFDANKDGMISSEEVAGVLKALGAEISDDEISKMMDEVDSDKDGFISLQEFASFYCSSSSDEDSGKEMREAFELYDQDHDGFISAAELHQILTRLGERCSVPDCEVMIQPVDSDKDGKVSFDEFKTMMATNKISDA